MSVITNVVHRDGSWAQDMVLHLNTPQMNRLRYLVGVELRSFKPAGEFPEYDGDEPYLMVDDDDEVLRSASERERREVQNLADQLDALWACETCEAQTDAVHVYTSKKEQR